MENQQNNSHNELVMQFDPNTIEHLGVHMYSTLPPVIAELVSNGYDADAKSVEVYLNDSKDKTIVIKDDGHGMTFDDINKKFLKIGRNRRKSDESKILSIQKTESGNRFAIGKKGIGKLSFFGIAGLIKVDTIRDGKQNIFELDWKALSDSVEDYKPTIIEKDRETTAPKGTKITLMNITRKSGFDPDNISYNLAKSFSIFDDDFVVKIIHNNTTDPIIVKNEMRYQNIIPEFEWELPFHQTLDVGYSYENADKITGRIISAKDTVPAALKGVTLFSRGKLVNEPEFYDEKATSFGYSYLTGWLNVDFIDDWQKDVISTNRKSLNWEDDDAAKLRLYLNAVIKYIYKDQRKKRKEKQYALIRETSNINLDEWLNSSSLPKHEQKLAKKMVDAVLASEGMPTEKQAELVKYIKDSFQFETFKQIASEFEETEDITTQKIIELFKEWEIIEAREMYKLATGRIETIKTLERLIDLNAKEVTEIHPFFEKFPWVLDPRINMFKHEASYVKILKDTYNEPDVEDVNRRIDFLCTSVSQHKFIIELKRPKHKLTYKDIEQAKDYRSFIEDYVGNDRNAAQKVIAYVIGGSKGDDRKTRDEIGSMFTADKVYIKTYHELLTDARNYHTEFIERYENIEKVKKNM